MTTEKSTQTVTAAELAVGDRLVTAAGAAEVTSITQAADRSGWFIVRGTRDGGVQRRLLGTFPADQAVRVEVEGLDR